MKVISLSHKINSFDYLSNISSKLDSLTRQIKNNFSLLYMNISTFIKERKNYSSSTPSGQNFSVNKYFKFFKIGAIAIVVVLLLYGAVKVIGSFNLGTKIGSGQKIDVLPARSSQDINKEFSFPLRNGDGEEVSKIKMTIDKVELRDQIIISGKAATSVKGRVFLIINLKVKNEFNQTIKINTRDYIRLSVNNNEEEWLAPNIHNDPVEVQAISTKPTRVGFAINETDKDLVLTVGEINGDKERIELDPK